MSRTHRRKKVTEDRILEDQCYEIHGCSIIRCYEFLHCSRDCPVRDNKQTISKYRRDTKEGYGWAGNAPKSFRKVLNRERKSRDRAETNRIWREADYDEYSYDKWIKDSGWLYW